MFAIPSDHFYDDFMAADLAAGGDSARRGIEAIVSALAALGAPTATVDAYQVA